MAALADYLDRVAGPDSPLIIAGDFNDWRNRAGSHLAQRLGLTEVFSRQRGRAGAQLPGGAADVPPRPHLRARLPRPAHRSALRRTVVRNFRPCGAVGPPGAAWRLSSCPGNRMTAARFRRGVLSGAAGRNRGGAQRDLPRKLHLRRRRDRPRGRRRPVAPPPDAACRVHVTVDGFGCTQFRRRLRAAAGRWRRPRQRLSPGDRALPAAPPPPAPPAPQAGRDRRPRRLRRRHQHHRRRQRAEDMRPRYDYAVRVRGAGAAPGAARSTAHVGNRRLGEPAAAFPQRTASPPTRPRRQTQHWPPFWSATTSATATTS